jgi:ComF family protein
VIHRLKYGNSPWIGSKVGHFIGSELLEPEDIRSSVVVPVPLHRKREIERGYNQSEWVARGIKEVTGIPLDSRMVIRRRMTATQTRLGRDARMANVEGAFSMRRSLPPECHVILVDDTITSAATLFSCARVLLEAGAASVLPIAVASAPLHLVMEPRTAIPVTAF